MPDVSIIIPTCNRNSLLRRAVRSVLDQTYQNIEVLIINNGDMNIKDILKDFEDERINYLDNTITKGLSATRNMGLKNAKGRYIAYLDDDDIYYPEHIETLFNYLENNKAHVAYTDALRAYMEEHNDTLVTIHKDRPYSVDFDPNVILIQNIMPVLTVMHRRECIEKAGYFDETLTNYEDWEFWIRLSLYYTFHHIKKITCEFSKIINKSSLTKASKRDFLKNTRVIYKKYQSVISSKSWLKKACERNLEILQSNDVDMKCQFISNNYKPERINIPISILVKVEETKNVDSVYKALMEQKKIDWFEIIFLVNGSMQDKEIKSVFDRPNVRQIDSLKDVKGDVVFLITDSYMPLNRYCIYNSLIPLFSYPDMAALTFREFSHYNLYASWLNKRRYTNIFSDKDFYIQLVDPHKYINDKHLIDIFLKNHLGFIFGDVLCIRREYLEDSNIEDLMIESLIKGKKVTFLSSTGFYKINQSIEDVLLSNIKRYRESAIVPAFFYFSRKISMDKLIKDILEVYNLTVYMTCEIISKNDFVINKFITLLEALLADPCQLKNYAPQKTNILNILQKFSKLNSRITVDMDFKHNVFLDDFITLLKEFLTFITVSSIDVTPDELKYTLLAIWAEAAGKSIGTFLAEESLLNQ